MGLGSMSRGPFVVAMTAAVVALASALLLGFVNLRRFFRPPVLIRIP